MMILLTLLNVLNFVDRQLIGSLGPKLMADLMINREQIGLLSGYAFVVLYTGMGLILGTVADRRHRPRLIAIGLLVWSALTAVSGSAAGFLQLAAARVFVGVGEATLTPASLSMLSDIIPARLRAFASGVYYVGFPLGFGLSVIISGWMATNYGWRACFYLLGIIGIVLVPFVLLLPNPQREYRSTWHSPNIKDICAHLLDALRGCPALWLAMLGGALYNYASASSALVLTFAVTERGLPYQKAAYIQGAIICLAGVVGVVMGGVISDRLHQTRQGGRLIFLIANAVLLFPFSLGFALLPRVSPLFYICWFFATLGTMAWYGPVFATIADLAPAHIRSTALAFLLVVLSVLGTGLGPWITGKIGDSYSLEKGLMISSVVGLTAIIPLSLAIRRYPTESHFVGSRYDP